MMGELPCLHVRLAGLTASYRQLLTISGTQLSLPVPSFANLLGTISACAGRSVPKDETRIGFEFHIKSLNLDLERTDRLATRNGRLVPQSKGPGMLRRQFLVQPRLDLYLDNLSLKSAFLRPAATPCFGRSQDIAWIEFVREIQIAPTEQGGIGPTLLPLPQLGVPGMVVRTPEWMENDRFGYCRKPGPFGLYLAMIPTTDLRFEIARPDLFIPSDCACPNDVICLHRWLESDA